MARLIDDPAYILRSSEARDIYNEIKNDPIFDIHTHIDYHSPVIRNAGDILSYHYFKEMVHSQGVAKEALDGNLAQKEVVKHLDGMRNTSSYYWLVALFQKFFDLEDNYVNPDNWGEICSQIENKSFGRNWEENVRKISNIEHIGLTNCIWEKLDGINDTYLPNLRIDDLINVSGIKKIEAHSGSKIENLDDLEEYISDRFKYFIKNNCTAASVSLQPDFQLMKIDRKSISFSKLNKTEFIELNKIKAHILNYVIERCSEYKIPFQIMFGVKRDVYKHGVLGGRDLSDPTTSLGSLAYILNNYPEVNFLISVINQTQSQELAEYARIFPNVYASGHWWYGGTERKIEQSLIERLELSPYVKHIGQYSDAYTMEFIWPKIDMYRRAESNVFAELCVKERKLTIDECVDMIRARDYRTPKRLMNR